MSYIVLQDVRGKAVDGPDGNYIQFSWSLPVWDRPIKHISIIPRDSNLQPQTFHLSQFMDGVTGYKYPLQGRKKVARMEFLVLASDTILTPDQTRQMEEPYCPVLVGRAEVHYKVNTQPQGEIARIDLHVHSSDEIAEGVLGYTYRCGGVQLRYLFPGTIKNGMNTYPSIYVPAGEKVAVITINSADSAAISIVPGMAKMNWFRKLFVR